MMTVRDLIEALNQFDPDSVVHVATQPNYPIRQDIATITALPLRVEDLDDDGDGDEAEGYLAAVDEDVPPVVWIACDQQTPWDESPYAPRAAWDGVL